MLRRNEDWNAPPRLNVGRATSRANGAFQARGLRGSRVFAFLSGTLHQKSL